ncbi:DUF2125 domain-containing protein [Afifella sp. IM 167]|uniref:DUF2125 domain-containing protein n=1 Tax=Afifella sp. IM 167 TaxID=2033586 RepID=UPI001CC96C64|nr:DUF2125 domain-containing protein [Afifella sp. IM 167]MBZ8132846.1 hypothetical protein [Afifella sp. IM 167]
MGRLVTILVALLILIAVLWSAGWWGLASYTESQVDAFIAGQAEGEVAITCPNRSVGGYPFRLKLRCEGPVRLVSADLEAEAPALAAVARVEEPSQVETELQSPLKLSTPFLAEPLTITWEQALLKSGLTEPRFSLRLVQAAAGQGGFSASALSGSGALGPADSAGDTSVEIALSDLTLSQGSLSLPKSDLVIRAEMAGEPQMLLAGAPQWRVSGLNARHLSAELKVEGARILVDGPVEVDPNGILSGQLDVTVTGLDVISGKVADLPDGLREPAQLVLAAVGGLGVPTEVDGVPARQLTISVENGKARVAFLNLGRVPRLY